jgi:hypothetical protein
VNKEHFNKLVSNYTKVDGEFNELEKLVHEYPYSQPLRVLSAKSSTKKPKAEYHKRLSTAAFYATDRNVLRTLIETGLVPSDSSSKISIKQSVAPKKVAPIAKTKGKQVPIKKEKSLSKAISGDELRDDVIHNLDELLIAKANFFKIMGMEDMVQHTPKKASHSQKKTSVKTSKIAKPVIEKEKPIVAKETPASTQASKPVKSTRKSNKDELIDKFIAKSPSITPNKVSSDNQSDLSRASSELKEDLVSENLALIFAGQGKTAKAIEIYKKLIWKFPQKKASFAARIEELKKK